VNSIRQVPGCNGSEGGVGQASTASLGG